MPHHDRLNIAVFIDFDNIEIGVRTTLNEHFDAGIILDAIKERGEVITKIAYADWTRAGEYSRNLTQHAIRLVQRNLTPGGDKNGADINLALDALEMAFTHPHINAYVIVGGDSDFLSLVEKLKQYDKKVFVVGGRAFTSVILQRNCHEFIAYENLVGGRRSASRGGRPAPATATTPIGQAFPIVRRALKILSDREVTPQTGLLKSTLLQLDSTFSERNYGASSFLDFAEKLAQSGLVQLKHSGRSVLVELNEAFDETDAAGARPRTTGEEPLEEPAPSGVTPASLPSTAPSASGGPPVARPAQDEATRRPDAPPAGDTAEGVRQVGRILAAAVSARWPMYLRNVKQVLRNADGGFDERRYGFGGLMDLLRACQREGLVRLERDRRGGLRVFPGATLARPDLAAAAPVASVPELGVSEFEAADVPSSEAQAADIEPESPTEPGPIPVDTTAELLGTARRKRARPGVTAVRRTSHLAAPTGAPHGAARGSRRGATRRTASAQARPRQPGRTKKVAAAEPEGKTDAS